jgi:hypothetical protein
MFPTGTWPINAGPKVNVAGDTNSPAACESGRIIPPFAIFVLGCWLSPIALWGCLGANDSSFNCLLNCFGGVANVHHLMGEPFLADAELLRPTQWSCMFIRKASCPAALILSFCNGWASFMSSTPPHKKLVHHASRFPDRGGARLRDIDVRAVTCLAG